MSELLRLSEVMQRLRAECPWDAQQSHRSLVKHLIEEAAHPRIREELWEEAYELGLT